MSVTHRMESQRGRIGKEIKSGLDKNNKPWANFSLATDINRLNEQGQWEKVGTEWYQVSVFGAQAKNVADSLRPGTPVVVSGDVEQSVRVVQGQDGEPVAQTRNEVRADMVAPDMILTAVQLPERPAPSGPTESGPGMSEQWGPQTSTTAPSQRQPTQPSGGFGGPAEHGAPTAAAGWPEVVQPGTGAAGIR